MRKMLAGIVLTLLLQGTAHNAFAYYTLSLGNPGLWPDGQMEYTVWSHWDVNDPRPFPCGPKPTGNPSISCQLTVVFYSPQGKKSLRLSGPLLLRLPVLIIRRTETMQRRLMNLVLL